MEPNKNLLPLQWNSGKKDRPGCLHPIFISFFGGEIGACTAGCPPLGAQDGSRELNFIPTNSKNQQLPVPATRDQCQLWLLHMTSVCSGGSQGFFFCQRQMNTLGSSEAWGRRMRNSGVIWIPSSRGGVSQPQKSFSLMLTHKASLRDLSIKLQHAMQKN